MLKNRGKNKNRIKFYAFKDPEQIKCDITILQIWTFFLKTWIFTLAHIQSWWLKTKGSVKIYKKKFVF